MNTLINSEAKLEPFLHKYFNTFLKCLFWHILHRESLYLWSLWDVFTKLGKCTVLVPSAMLEMKCVKGRKASSRLLTNSWTTDAQQALISSCSVATWSILVTETESMVCQKAEQKFRSWEFFSSIIVNRNITVWHLVGVHTATLSGAVTHFKLLIGGPDFTHCHSQCSWSSTRSGTVGSEMGPQRSW